MSNSNNSLINNSIVSSGNVKNSGFKRLFRSMSAIITIIAIVISAASCNSAGNAVTSFTPDEIARVILSSQKDMALLEILLSDDEYYTEYISGVYGFEPGILDDGIVLYAGGILADEIAVFKLSNASDAIDIKEALIDYKTKRASVFIGYAPEQSALLKNGIVADTGVYIALLVCNDPLVAQEAFMSCFIDKQPQISDMPPLQTYLHKSSGSDDYRGNKNDSSVDIFNPDDSEISPNNNTDNSSTDASSSDSSSSDDSTSSSFVTPESESSGDNQTDSADPATNPLTGGKLSDDNNDSLDKASSADSENVLDSATDNVTDDNASDNVASDVSSSDAPSSDAPSSDPRFGPYDPDAILKAWRSGEELNLSAKNQYILSTCKDIITSIIRDDMSDYDKELAIHDWIIDWAEYDPEALSNSPKAKPDPDNDNPYGLLFSKKAICSGFTSTFQLFMDMLNIRCISVHGFSGSEREEHAWNMVVINSNWYCVDVTWDSPNGVIFTRDVRHTYFNVSSDFMKRTSHYWDEALTPAADSDKLYFG